MKGFGGEIKPPQKNYFSLIITSLKIFGIGIEDIKNPIEAILYNGYTFISIVCFLYYYLIAQTIDFALHLDDFERSSFSLTYMISQFVGVFKGTIFLVNRKSLSKYCKNFENEPFAPNLERGGTEEYKYVNRAIKITNAQAICFYTFVLFIVVNAAISAIFDYETIETFVSESNTTISQDLKVLPYNIYLPFDTQKHYYSAFCYQVFSCAFFGLYIGAIDAMLTGIMIHLKAQLLILKNSLLYIKQRAYAMCQKSNQNLSNTLIDDDPLKKVPPEVQTFITKIVRDVVRHHQEIILLVDNTESQFNILMLSQFIGSLLVTCVAVFQMSLHDVNSPTFVGMAAYLILMLFQLLIYCWNGNELSLESLDVARAVFDCDWIQFDDDSQKALMLMIMRAQRPLRLSAGKFAFLSLETYISILRGSSSYYLALRQMSTND